MNDVDAIKTLRDRVQDYSNKITEAVGPISNLDMPCVLFALKAFEKALEGSMDKKEKELYDCLTHIFGVRSISSSVPRPKADALYWDRVLGKYGEGERGNK